MTQSQDTFEGILFKRIGGGEEITTVAVGSTDHRGVRFAAGTRDMLVHVWVWSEQLALDSIFAVPLLGTVSIGLTFLDNSTHDIEVFGI